MFTQFFDTPAKPGYTSITFGSLRLGMEIWTDLPWYKHPFPKNRFKIATPKQLQTIRSLKLSCLFYHPTLSDPESTLVPDAPSFPGLSGLHALIEDQEVPLQPAECKPPATPRLALQHANTLYGQTLRRSREALPRHGRRHAFERDGSGTGRPWRKYLPAGTPRQTGPGIVDERLNPAWARRTHA